MNATRIDHRGVNLPDPTLELLNEMAIIGYETMVHIHVESGLIPAHLVVQSWNDIPQYRRDAWLLVSRALYALIAQKAGAKVTVMETGD